MNQIVFQGQGRRRRDLILGTVIPAFTNGRYLLPGQERLSAANAPM
jgi:hypothetical protein